MKLRIGTRGSELALWQARHVAALLAPEAQCELIVLKTRGDLIDDVPLQSLEGKAFFTGEIEQALLERRVDLAVHSHKDLPTQMTPGLSIAAIPARASAAERLLVREASLHEQGLFLPLREGAIVGTSSPRRAAQLALLRPDLRTLSLRGNVPTRVARLREGRYDAIVLAAAGLDRLGLDLRGLHTQDLELRHFVPAPAQGALAIQIREGDAGLRELLRRRLHDEGCAQAVEAERRLLQRAGGGCNLPLGAAITGDGPYRAFVFLGAGHPRAQDRSRWAEAEAHTAAAAADAAFAKLGERAHHGGPLAGCSIAISGSRAAAEDYRERLESLGAQVAIEEVIRFEDLPETRLVERAAALRAGEALAITSRETARRLAGLRLAPGVLVAAVGSGSAAALRAVGLEPGLVGEHGGAALAAQLAQASVTRVLFPCAAQTAGELEHELETHGVPFERLPLYRTLAHAPSEMCTQAPIRILLSASSVQAAAALLPRSCASVNIVLGRRAAQACAEVGWTAQAAASPRLESVVESVVRVHQAGKIPT